MTPLERVKHLRSLGFIHQDDPTDAQVKVAEEQAQLYLGGRIIESDQYLDELLEAPRCGCPEAVMANGLALWPTSKWKNRRLNIFIDKSVPSVISVTDWAKLTRDVLDELEDASGLRFEVQTTDRNAADAFMVGATIDGQGGVLADQELPTGVEQHRALRMRLDVAEKWASSSKFLLARRTVRHEGGHRDGLEHIPASMGLSVMNPTLQPIDQLDDLMKRQYTIRYPKSAAPVPPTNNPPTTPEKFKFTIHCEGAVVEGFRLIPSN
jgi:hypothetical protein